MRKLIYRLALVLLTFASVTALAGTVTKVNAKKKSVTIDQGKSNGVEKDAEACFVDQAGTKVGCGTVKSVKAKSATVKIKDKKVMKAIVEGMTVEIGGAATSGSTPAGAAHAGSKFMAVRLMYLPTLLSQAVYNKMTYRAPEATGDMTTLWDPGQKSSQALMTIGLEFDLIGPGIALGVRPLRTYQEFQIDSDFDRAVATKFVRTTVTGSALGFYLDYNFMNPKGGISGMRIGAGLDIDMSTVTYKAVQMEDKVETETPLYDISSKLTVISLRVPAGYQLSMGSMGLNFGLNLMVPVVGNEPTATNDIQDANTSRYAGGSEEEKTAAAEADLKTSLGHTKNSFAAELVLGAFFAF
jgi:hypothetical protein